MKEVMSVSSVKASFTEQMSVLALGSGKKFVDEMAKLFEGCAAAGSPVLSLIDQISGRVSGAEAPDPEDLINQIKERLGGVQDEEINVCFRSFLSVFQSDDKVEYPKSAMLFLMLLILLLIEKLSEMHAKENEALMKMAD